MMTARAEPEDQLRSFKIGADDYITKPFDPRLIAARVAAQLRRSYRYEVASQTKPQNDAATAGKPPQDDLTARDALMGLPSDWAGCDACNYMGPSSRFERRDEGAGQSFTICPHCKTGKTIAFAIC